MNILLIDEYTEIPISDKALRVAIYQAHRGICFYTGRSIAFEDMHIDHIVPRSKGGKNCIANYVVCYKAINLAKHAKLNEDEAQKIVFINKTNYVQKVLASYIYIKSFDSKIHLPKKKNKTIERIKEIGLFQYIYESILLIISTIRRHIKIKKTVTLNSLEANDIEYKDSKESKSYERVMPKEIDALFDNNLDILSNHGININTTNLRNWSKRKSEKLSKAVSILEKKRIQGGF